MPLETAPTITDLVTSNPAHTDGLSQADSHMRLIKSSLKGTFPNFTAATAVASTQAQIDAAVASTLGTTAYGFKPGTALLPGLFPLGDPDTGFFWPAANQLGITLGGSQVALMGGSALVTSLSIACAAMASAGLVSAAAVASSGAYSGGTGQLVPIGAVLEWYDDVLPAEGGYAWANGQIIASANTVCPVLLARWGTRFGGNGTTTMGVPDRRDTVGVGKSTMGGVSSRALQTLTNTVLGTLFGLANNVLAALNIPTITSVNASQAIAVTSTQTGIPLNATNGTVVTPNSPPAFFVPGSGSTIAIGQVTSNGTNSISTTYTNGSQTAVNNVQPSTTCNYILRLG